MILGGNLGMVMSTAIWSCDRLICSQDKVCAICYWNHILESCFPYSMVDNRATGFFPYVVYVYQCLTPHCSSLTSSCLRHSSYTLSLIDNPISPGNLSCKQLTTVCSMQSRRRVVTPSSASFIIVFDTKQSLWVKEVKPRRVN